MSEMPAQSRRWLVWLPAMAVMAIIFVLSAQSGLKVSEDAAVDKPFRVTGHLLAYATLAACLLVALGWGQRPRLRHALIGFGITFLYAITDEWHQSFVPDRSGRLDDVVTDAIGALVGLAAAWTMLTVATARRQRDPQSGP